MVTSPVDPDRRDDDDRSEERVTLFEAEVERLREEAVHQRRVADRRARFWAFTDIAMGFPAALLAGVSGAAGLAFAEARVPAAVLALLAAGFSAGAGFLRSDVRRTANKRARRAWAALEDEARLVQAGGFHHDGRARLSSEAIHQALRSLFDRRQAALSAYEGDSAEA
ncbi:MAG: hypothetical protein ACRDP3_12130 [Streptomyces sp.]|uniref:hypothetical protein n=1 Tax=Streptomyces sp. TaxID=1931 RepID=UPI003D6B3D38